MSLRVSLCLGVATATYTKLAGPENTQHTSVYTIEHTLLDLLNALIFYPVSSAKATKPETEYVALRARNLDFSIQLLTGAMVAVHHNREPGRYIYIYIIIIIIIKRSYVMIVIRITFFFVAEHVLTSIHPNTTIIIYIYIYVMRV